MVTIHVHFPGALGNTVIAIARFAVPFFFIVSGFFSYYETPSLYDKKLPSKIRHTAILTIGSAVFYLIFKLVLTIPSGSTNEFLNKVFSGSFAIELFVFNHAFCFEHLWFMFALLYVYIFFAAVCKLKLQNKAVLLIPILFIRLIFGKELQMFLSEGGYDIPEIFKQGYLFRNFASTGIPFFLLGWYIRKNEARITSKAGDSLLIILMLVGTAEAIAVNQLHGQKSVFAGTVIATAALFIFIIKNENRFNAPKLSEMGAKYSLYIYIFHIAIRNCVDWFLKIIDLSSDILAYLMPVIIFILSLIFSIIYCEIKKILKKLFSEKIKQK